MRFYKTFSAHYIIYYTYKMCTLYTYIYIYNVQKFVYCAISFVVYSEHNLCNHISSSYFTHYMILRILEFHGQNFVYSQQHLSILEDVYLRAVLGL